VALKLVLTTLVCVKLVTRNAWQSLACSPRGIAVTSSSVQVKENWVVSPQKTQYRSCKV